MNFSYPVRLVDHMIMIIDDDLEKRKETCPPGSEPDSDAAPISVKVARMK